ncbi:hypothetical protein [Streptomyces sp. NPDC093707]|uniref:hypothetical protein n=1 Tax=Streptomyces sp. NPDC093707 TaxID=3154984 RepID=UPI00344C252F
MTNGLNGLDDLEDHQKQRRRRTGPPPPAHQKALGVPAPAAGEEKKAEVSSGGGQEAKPSAPSPGPAEQVGSSGSKELVAQEQEQEQEQGNFPVAPRTSPVSGAGTPSYTLSGDGTPWSPGPGRPANLPTPADVLNRRSVARESLDASVAAELKLKKRLKRFALDNDLENLPLGDVVSVAIDDWLTARGY